MKAEREEARLAEERESEFAAQQQEELDQQQKEKEDEQKASCIGNFLGRKLTKKIGGGGDNELHQVENIKEPKNKGSRKQANSGSKRSGSSGNKSRGRR